MTMYMRLGAALTAAALVGLPAAASAQTGFAGAAIGVDVLRFTHQSSRSPSIYDDDISGETGRWSLTGGGTIKRHAILQAEFAETRELATDIAPMHSVVPCPSCGSTETTVRYRSKQFAVLGGYTSGQWRRVSISALAGLVFVGRSTRVTSTYRPVPPAVAPIPNTSDYTYTRYSIGPVFGIDVPILAAPHFQVVPEVRLYQVLSDEAAGGPPAPLVTSVSVGVRWAF